MDYKLQKVEPKINPKITRYIAVSKEAAKHFKELTGKDVEVIYNPVEIDEPERIIKLISATRLTKEKGKERMERMGDILNRMGIRYIWLIFTDDIGGIDNPNIIYMKPKLDITSYIKEADFLVQLSTSESYCYSVVESLVLGTPVITTDLAVYKEIGLNDNNSIRLDLEFEEIDKNKLLKKYNFKYKPIVDGWEKLLGINKTTYKQNLATEVKLKYTYFLEMYLVEEDRQIKQGDIIETNEERADELLKTGYFEKVE
jgi:hypothetical protein